MVDAGTMPTQNDVLETILANHHSVVRCCPAGQVVHVSWHIDCDGRVFEPWVKETALPRSKEGKCIEDAIASWRFRAYGGPRPPLITFPFRCKGDKTLPQPAEKPDF